MVLIRGDNDDIWHAHVQSVDCEMKSCQVYFYVQDANCPVKYRREASTMVRTAKETILWDSILSHATGFWEGRYWMQE